MINLVRKLNCHVQVNSLGKRQSMTNMKRSSVINLSGLNRPVFSIFPQNFFSFNFAA